MPVIPLQLVSCTSNHFFRDGLCRNGLGPETLAWGDNSEAVSLTSLEGTLKVALAWTGRTLWSSGEDVSPSGGDRLAPKGME